MSADNVSIGKKIKKLRLANNLTQAEFAKLFNLNQQSISRYENGNFQIPYNDLAKIAKYFQISTDYFFDVEIQEIKGDEFLILAYYRAIRSELKDQAVNLMKTLAVEFPNDQSS